MQVTTYFSGMSVDLLNANGGRLGSRLAPMITSLLDVPDANTAVSYARFAGNVSEIAGVNANATTTNATAARRRLFAPRPRALQAAPCGVTIESSSAVAVSAQLDFAESDVYGLLERAGVSTAGLTLAAATGLLPGILELFLASALRAAIGPGANAPGASFFAAVARCTGGAGVEFALGPVLAAPGRITAAPTSDPSPTAVAPPAASRAATPYPYWIIIAATISGALACCCCGLCLALRRRRRRRRSEDPEAAEGAADAAKPALELRDTVSHVTAF